MRVYRGFCFPLVLLFILSLRVSIGLAVEAPQTDRASSSDSARDTWLRGISLFEKGENAEMAGDLAKALTFYQEATKIFKGLKLDSPDWHPKFVDFRINRCLKKLEDIKVALNKKHISVSNASHENVLLRERIDEQGKKIASLKAELAKTLADLESARRESLRDGRSASTLEKVMREKAELNKKCALLEDTNKRLLKDNPGAGAMSGKEELDKALGRAAMLEKSNRQLRALLDKGRAALTGMAEEKARLEYELKLSKASEFAIRKRLDETSAALKAKNEALDKTLEQNRQGAESSREVEKALAAANASITKLRATLKQIRSKSGDEISKQLQSENEMLLRKLELAHLELDKANKDRGELRTKLSDTSRKVNELGKLLALKDKQNTVFANDLQTIRDKLFVSDAVIKKQNAALEKEKKKYTKLKRDFDALVEQSKDVDNRTKELLSLAKSEELAKAENRRLAAKIKDLEAENAGSVLNLEKSEKRLDSLKSEYSQLLVGKSKLEAECARLSLRAKSADALEARLKKMDEEKRQRDSVLSGEMSDRKAEMEKLQKELDSALREVGDAKVERQTWKEKLLAADAKVVALTAEVERLKRDGAKAAEGKSGTKTEDVNATPDVLKMEGLRKENAALKTRLEEATKRIADLEARRASDNSGAPAAPPPVTSSKNTKQFRELLKMAKEAEKNGTVESEIWYYEKAHAINPDDTATSTRLGYAYARVGDDEKAVAMLGKALAKDTKNIDALLALAFCHIKRKEYYLALGAVAKANALRPQDPRIQRYLGVVCENLGWKNAAERQYESSFKLDPTSSETAYNVAALLCGEEGRKKDSILWYKKALQLGAKRDAALEKALKIKVRIKGSRVKKAQKPSTPQ